MDQSNSGENLEKQVGKMLSRKGKFDESAVKKANIEARQEFAGNGATSVVELLIDCLGIKYYASDEVMKPVVFVGPYEHHSNLLPWRESGCEVVMIPESPQNQNVDVAYLERMLQSPTYSGRMLKMGAFTAASNVTGKVADVDAIAATLHKYGALAFFDYATGAPYLPINMNPFPNGNYGAADIAKDAIFLSPHKMIGGVQTPGVLIIKKHLINQTVPPKRSGGGTVFYVTHKHHRFLSNRIERYEGGTPNVVGIFRAGLACLVKRMIEDQYLKAMSGAAGHEKESIPPTLIDYEFQTHRYVVQRLKNSAPNILILGLADEADASNHLPIFSFLIKCGERFLHYNYVCAILNDLFGIQSRGGCQVSMILCYLLLSNNCHSVLSNLFQSARDHTAKNFWDLLASKAMKKFQMKLINALSMLYCITKNVLSS
jgi:selenocysteine lyase/cysteine desulfurase